MTKESDIEELDVVEASGLPAEYKFLVHTIWAVRNFLRERNNVRPLQDWTMVDIIDEIKMSLKEAI